MSDFNAARQTKARDMDKLMSKYVRRAERLLEAAFADPGAALAFAATSRRIAEQAERISASWSGAYADAVCAEREAYRCCNRDCSVHGAPPHGA